MHEGLKAVATYGVVQLCGFSGGAKRSGGESAKGTPRKRRTGEDAEATAVGVPTIGPLSIVAVGVGDPYGTARTRAINKQESKKELCIVTKAIQIQTIFENANTNKEYPPKETKNSPGTSGAILPDTAVRELRSSVVISAI